MRIKPREAHENGQRAKTCKFPVLQANDARHVAIAFENSSTKRLRGKRISVPFTALLFSRLRGGGWKRQAAGSKAVLIFEKKPEEKGCAVRCERYYVAPCPTKRPETRGSFSKAVLQKFFNEKAVDFIDVFDRLSAASTGKTAETRGVNVEAFLFFENRMTHKKHCFESEVVRFVKANCYNAIPVPSGTASFESR